MIPGISALSAGTGHGNSSGIKSRILESLADLGSATTVELQQITGASESGVTKALNELAATDPSSPPPRRAAPTGVIAVSDS